MTRKSTTRRATDHRTTTGRGSDRAVNGPEIDGPEIDGPEIDCPEIDDREINSRRMLDRGAARRAGSGRRRLVSVAVAGLGAAAVVAGTAGTSAVASAATGAPGSAVSRHPAALHPAGGALLDRATVRPRFVQKAPTSASGVTPTSLPVSVDLSAWDMPVGDQGQVGSCVTWAINYSMMGWYSNHQLGTPTAFAPMYVYSQVDGGVDDGTYPAAAYGIATAQGVDTQADYFQGNDDYLDQPTAAETANAALHKESGPFSDLYSDYSPPGPAADGVIEAALAAGHPVALSIPVYHAFDVLDPTDYHLDASEIDPSTFRGNHEVLAVGYDATGVRIENQWGTDWGQAGYANLDWNFVEQYSQEATTMPGLVAPHRAVPSVPTTVGVKEINARQATLSWAPPATAGDSPVTGYRVSRNVGTGWSTTVAATARSATFTLLPGTTYTLSVQAINASGTGAAGARVIAMATSLPSAPRTFRIVVHSGTHSATMSWTPPATAGQYPITGYRVARNGIDSHNSGAWSTTVPATAPTQVFGNLVAGRTYTLTVTAITSHGTGTAAAGQARMP